MVHRADAAATSLIWMELEFNMGIIAGSLSSLPKLFKIKGVSSSRGTYPLTDHPSNDSQGFEMGSDSRKDWKGRGIKKTSEALVTVDSNRNESQECIVPIYGQGRPTVSSCTTQF